MGGFFGNLEHSLKETGLGFVAGVEAPVNTLYEEAQRLVSSKDVKPLINEPKTDGSIAANIGKGLGVLTDLGVAAYTLAPVASSILPDLKIVEAESEEVSLASRLLPKMFHW